MVEDIPWVRSTVNFLASLYRFAVLVAASQEFIK